MKTLTFIFCFVVAVLFITIRLPLLISQAVCEGYSLAWRVSVRNSFGRNTWK